MKQYIAVVVAGQLDQRFIELYEGHGCGHGPHHQLVLYPTRCAFAPDPVTGDPEPVPGSEKELEPMDLGTVFAFTQGRGRIHAKNWIGRCAGVQLGEDIEVLGKVDLSGGSAQVGKRVKALLDEKGIKCAQLRDGRFRMQANEEYQEKHPEEWQRVMERSKLQSAAA